MPERPVDPGVRYGDSDSNCHFSRVNSCSEQEKTTLEISNLNQSKYSSLENLFTNINN